MNDHKISSEAAPPESIQHAPALDVKGVTYAYGDKKALSDVGFSVASGSCTILLGPNGAGKTTLFSLITRLYESRAGSISVAGHDLKTASSKALAALGVVFQQPTLDLDLTILQNLRYHAALYGMSRRTSEPRIEEELERFGLRQRSGEKVRQLNGGHRRRVEIARALLHQPRLLILDEPTVGLDVPSRRVIVDHVHDLVQSGLTSVLWATHLIDEIRETDQLIVIHKGKVRASCNIPELLSLTGTGNISDAFSELTKEQGPK